MKEKSIGVFLVGLSCVFPSACGSPTGPSGPSTLLSVNVVDPQDINAVSTFNSCVGHAYPQTNSPNSAKNYFWPNSTNFSTIDRLREYAACAGTTAQTPADLSPNEFDRGQTLHLNCDGSSTTLRYFHLNFDPGLVGHHVNAGDFMGYAALLGTGQTPYGSWQFSGNFDIAVSEQDDSRTENYFARLDATAFAAWAARGLTSISQTINAGNPTCSSYSSNVGDPGIFVFTPAR